MRRQLDLGNQAWGGAAGALPPFDLRTLLTDVDGDAYGLESLIFELTFDITTGAGGGCTGREILEWISNLIMRGSVGVPIQGMNAYQLNVLQGACLGVFTGIPDDIPINQVNDISVMHLIIPFARYRSRNPDEVLPAVQAFKDATVLLSLGAPALNANTVINGCTVRGFGRVRRQGKVRFPALPNYGSHADTIHTTLPDAQYDGLCMVAPAGGFAAPANLTNIVLRAGNEEIHNAVGPDNVLAAYLLDQTAGVGGGAATPLLGGAQNWTKGSAALLMFPLIWQNAAIGANKATDQVDSQGSALVLECDGTLVTAQYAYCYYPPNTAQNQSRQAQAFGAQMSSLDVVTPGIGGQSIESMIVGRKPGLRTLPAQVRAVVGSEAGRLAFIGRR